MAEDGSERRTQPRFSVQHDSENIPFLTGSNGEMIPFDIHDISISGLGISCEKDLTQVENLALAVADTTIAVRIAWGDGPGRYGLRLMDNDRDVIDLVYVTLERFVEAMK